MSGTYEAPPYIASRHHSDMALHSTIGMFQSAKPAHRPDELQRRALGVCAGNRLVYVGDVHVHTQ